MARAYWLRYLLLPSCLVLALVTAAPTSRADTLAPHRATYKVKLASIKNGGRIADVEGTMVYELIDTCDGWFVDQNVEYRFYYADGKAVNRHTRQTSWEARDGHKYRFITNNYNNDEAANLYRGTAVINTAGGEAQYEGDNSHTVKIPALTLLPSAHTMEIIRYAREGKNSFTRTVFDGNDESGMSEINTFIGKKIADTQATRSKESKLLKGESWPVRMAFFTTNAENGASDYEIGMQLMGNGVASAITIDYGDFALNGSLVDLEETPTPACSPKS